MKETKNLIMKPRLNLTTLCNEATRFAKKESKHLEPSIYGITDGKAIGTYFEHKFKKYLHTNHDYTEGNSARGIDFPELGVDMKVTSVKQPQSSCPFKSARQKIFGLGYSLLVFVYQKTDDKQTQTGRLNILHGIFIEERRTADFQTTKGLRQILENNANTDDVLAFLSDRNLPIDDIEANKIAKEILKAPPKQGYLTVSNAFQWRLQYGRVIEKAGDVNGILRLR
ncbi:MAG: restriction endonuclease [Nitrospinales bacterium]